jgi:hypothetical protein
MKHSNVHVVARQITARVAVQSPRVAVIALLASNSYF